MSSYGPTFHVTPVDLCIIFECYLYISCIIDLRSAFITTFIVFIYFHRILWSASCSCEPELPSAATLPVGTGRPCGMVGSILCGASHCLANVRKSLNLRTCPLTCGASPCLTNNSLMCCKQTDVCHRLGDAWPHIPCMLKRSHSRGILTLALGYRDPTQRHTDTCHGIATCITCPLKRHTDNCLGIDTYIARPLSVPTQEAY